VPEPLFNHWNQASVGRAQPPRSRATVTSRLCCSDLFLGPKGGASILWAPVVPGCWPSAGGPPEPESTAPGVLAGHPETPPG